MGVRGGRADVRPRGAGAIGRPADVDGFNLELQLAVALNAQHVQLIRVGKGRFRLHQFSANAVLESRKVVELLLADAGVDARHFVEHDPRSVAGTRAASAHLDRGKMGARPDFVCCQLSLL
eukprot:782995-Prymnesium_polylepis.1